MDRRLQCARNETEEWVRFPGHGCNRVESRAGAGRRGVRCRPLERGKSIEESLD